MKLSQRLQKENQNLIPLQTHTRTGFRAHKTRKKHEIQKKKNKKSHFLEISKKPFLGLTLEQIKTCYLINCVVKIFSSPR